MYIYIYQTGPNWINMRHDFVNAKEYIEGILKEHFSTWEQITFDKKAVGDLLEEAKTLVGVRAALSVAMRKLPRCVGARSKSATVREARRLISALQIKEFPVAVNAVLDAAAATV